LVNIGMRWCAGLRSKANAGSTMALARDLDIPPLHATLSAYRARAYDKFPTLATCIAELMENRQGRVGWVQITKNWLSRYGPIRPSARELRDAGLRWQDVVRNHVWEQMERVEKSMTFARYRDAGFAEENGFVKQAFDLGTVARGTQYLIQLRCGYFWTTARAI